MYPPIRILTVLVGLLLAAACSNNHNTGTSPADTSQHLPMQDTAAQRLRVRNAITEHMLEQIISYYKVEYGNDSTGMTITREDTVLELDFNYTGSDTNAYAGILLVAYISLVADTDPVLSGDMNGDGKNDMLVTVHTEGGGLGGNAWWDDHFLFLAQPDGEIRLADTKADGEIMGGTGGYFSPKEITNQTITGIGNDYAENDGHCCPSLFYSMRVQFIDGELKTVKKDSIGKPEGF